MTGERPGCLRGEATETTDDIRQLLLVEKERKKRGKPGRPAQAPPALEVIVRARGGA